MTTRLRPVPDETSAPFWAATARHELALPRCRHCRQFSFPPDITCPHCHDPAPAFDFETVATTGKVRTWTTIHRSFLPGMPVPFLLVDVELDAVPDIRMIGQLVDGADTRLAIGDAVEVSFDDLGPDLAIPAFRLVRQGVKS